MRWSPKEPAKPGDRKTKTRFLIIPKTLLRSSDMIKESRVFEKTTILYEYKLVEISTRFGSYEVLKWVPIFWIGE